MPITLTCSCGQRLSIANPSAGQRIACVGCGKAMSIPAMGVLLPAKTTSKPVSRPVASPPSGRLAVTILAASGVLLLVGAGSLVAWSLSRIAPIETKPIAQNKAVEPVEKKPREEPPIERKRPEAPKEEPPPVIEPERPRPVFELPKRIVEPIKPKEKEAPPPVVEEKKPLNLLEPLKLVWKLKEAETFYQELIITQRSNFKTQGLVIDSLLQYRIVSRFKVQEKKADGALVVEQKIESAKLLQADDLSRTTIAGAITQMPGLIYTLHLNPQMDVTKFEAAMAGPQMKMQPVAGGLGLQMASLLDRDGWKELAQTTFFQMDQPLKANARWSKPLTHNWGALGSWVGKINFAYIGPEKDLHKISYGLQLTHKAPAAGAIGMMQFNGANFQTQQAGGVLLFDAVRGKVVAAEERFRVKGVVNANLLGQNALLEISEDQHFLIRIHDKNPN